MTCQVVDQAEVIPKYLNGQLDPAAQDNFEVHILECPECQDAVELLQRVREQLEASAHKIRSYQVAGRNLWWSWATVAACCVIAVLIGIRQAGVHKLAGYQRVQKQISTPRTPPEGQTAGTGSGLSPSASEAQQAAGTGSGNPQIAVNAPGGASAPSGKSESATLKPQMPARTFPQAGAGPSGEQTQVSSATDKNVQSANPNQVSTTGTPEQKELATAGSAGNLTPDKRTLAKPAIATNATLPSETVADKITQLAVVRPLPYSFSGLAASQPTGGGSTRGSHSSTSAVSGTAGSPQPGTAGFSTAQDYFRDGMTAYVEGRYETAADLLRQAVALDPELGEANLYLGICALLQGKASDAISPLRSASRQKKPSTAQAAHFYLAKAYLKLGQLADAEAELRAAAVLPSRLAGEANALIQRAQTLEHSDSKQ